jgi:hypothetical protein
MNARFYVYKNDETLGPYTREEIDERLNTGAFTPEDLFWCEGMGGRAPLSRMKKDPSSPPLLPRKASEAQLKRWKISPEPFLQTIRSVFGIVFPGIGLIIFVTGLFLAVINYEANWLFLTVPAFFCALAGAVFKLAKFFFIAFFLSPRNQASKNGLSFKLDQFLLAGGSVFLFYFYLVFDTSVETSLGYRVNNLGLMQERTLGCILSVGAIITGVILYNAKKARTK